MKTESSVSLIFFMVEQCVCKTHRATQWFGIYNIRYLSYWCDKLLIPACLVKFNKRTVADATELLDAGERTTHGFKIISLESSDEFGCFLGVINNGTLFKVLKPQTSRYTRGKNRSAWLSLAPPPIICKFLDVVTVAGDHMHSSECVWKGVNLSIATPLQLSLVV